MAMRTDLRTETVLITTQYRETLFSNTDGRTIKYGPYNRVSIDKLP